MSLDRNKGNDDFEDDYLELLNSVNVDEDAEQAKPHTASPRRTFEDISSNDVVISKPDRRRREFEDVYSSTGTEKGIDGDIIITRKPRRPADNSEHEREEEREYIPRRPAPPPAKNTGVEDEEEISDFEERRSKPHTKKKKSGISKPKIALAVILAVVIAFGVVLFGKVNSVLGKFNTADKVERIVDASVLKSSASVKNILFIGLDDANGETSRSDSMMLISVNEKTGKIVITSILRDVHVDIPDHGEAKINAAP